jgi:DNA-binding response OmpR family regulator
MEAAVIKRVRLGDRRERGSAEVVLMTMTLRNAAQAGGQVKAKVRLRNPSGLVGACEAGDVRLLLVEDDPTIAAPLREGLAREGFEVEWAPTGAAALAADPVDLVLLDLGLPDLEGRVVCQALRARGPVPIIVVSARGDEFDRVMLLELGADDYVVKPFGFRELVARIRAVLRRVPGGDAPAGPAVLLVGDLTVDSRTRTVTLAGETVGLTPKEFDLLVSLAADPGAVRSREQLIHDVWDEHWWGSTKTLDVHVASLRKKLRPDLIETVRSIGYRLNPSATAS